jgi:hypothetical protein
LIIISLSIFYPHELLCTVLCNVVLREGEGASLLSVVAALLLKPGVYLLYIGKYLPSGGEGGGRGVGTYQLSFGDKIRGYEEGRKCEKWEKRRKVRGK